MRSKSNKRQDGPLFPIEELSTDTFVKLPKKPSAESGSVKLYIIVAEPNIYLEGFNKDEMNSRPPSILRGALFLRIVKPVKIKSISLTFTGISRTEWPEGIPPQREEYFELNTITNHTWPFFNYINPNVENKGADIFIPRTEDELHEMKANPLTPISSNDINNDLHSIKSPTSLMSALIGSHSNTSTANSPKPKMKNVLLSSFRSTSSSKHPNDIDALSAQISSTSTITSNGGNGDDNKYFTTGDYIYTFELPIQSSLPESIKASYGSNSYFLDAHIERSGKFKSNLSAKRIINIVRAPFQESVEENQPIIINREWEGKLQYDIVIYSKQVVLNSYLPISFRMLPLEKVKIHRLRVYMTEHLDYYCHHRKVHRTEPPKKVMLLEHTPPEGSDNLLALNDDEIGGMELDFQVFVPEIWGQGRRLNPESDTDNIQSHHWIKICIRISKSEPTPEDPNKRKQYELTIDSPMHLLSPLCAHANTLLPSYEDQLEMDGSRNRDLQADVDKMMSPSEGTILESNLYKPTDNVPVEMLTAQAKPFSPIASPQLNAMSPELRATPVLTPVDMLEMLTPSVSSSTLNLNASIPPPLAKKSSTNHFPTLITVRPATAPLAPPPFAEHPPSYEEATKHRNSSMSSSSNSSTKSSLKSRSRSKSNEVKLLSGLSSVQKTNAGIVSSSTISHRGRHNILRHERDLSALQDNEEHDEEELHGLSFHITPIISAEASPSHSPIRSNHSSKLINKSFTPAFSWGYSSAEDTLDAALANLNIGNENETLGLLNDNEEDENGDISELYHANSSMMTIDTLSTQAPIGVQPRSNTDFLKMLRTTTEQSMDITDM